MNGGRTAIRHIFAPDEQHRRVAEIFLRCLGLVYFCAFASLWIQVRALAGTRGILPSAELMEMAGAQLSGFEKFHTLPTFCWMSSSNASLLSQCELGTVLSIVLLAGFIPGLASLLLWSLWLSLTVACRDFLGFQWENLLLESGCLAIFLAPWTLVLKGARGPSRLVIWLFWWLIFRLMFLSGMVKILSGDPAWRDLTALSYHYETQPLPTVLGWYAYHLPGWMHQVEAGIMYAIELLGPVLIFIGRRTRAVAAAAFVFLQVGIALTGNYCYFNFLTAILCLLLLDDKLLERFRRVRVDRAGAVAELKRSRAHEVCCGILAAIVLLLSTVQTGRALQFITSPPPGTGGILRAFEPFRSVNTYGLFAVMTKTRPEIIVEGSDDAKTWLPYEFRYKPGDLKQRPKFIAPHQPRLDWQMWFAALSSYEQSPWFVNFCIRLLQGEPDVLGLLQTNPFPAHPPKYIRATLYNYQFTDRATLRETGEWWKREYLRNYFGPISLKPAATEEVKP